MSEQDNVTYVIKDSGKRVDFDSGMVRDIEDNKPDYTYTIQGPMLERWAEHMAKGAAKYGRDNWMRARSNEELQRFRRSAYRHMIAWLKNEQDEDHAAAVIFNLNAAEYTANKMADQ